MQHSMFRHLYTVIVFIAWISQTDGGPFCDGKAIGYHGDPENCYAYYQCAGPAFPDYHHFCAPGTAWDWTIEPQNCNHNGYILCENEMAAKSSKASEVTTSTTTTTTTPRFTSESITPVPEFTSTTSADVITVSADVTTTNDDVTRSKTELTTTTTTSVKETTSAKFELSSTLPDDVRTTSTSRVTSESKTTDPGSTISGDLITNGKVTLSSTEFGTKQSDITTTPSVISTTFIEDPTETTVSQAQDSTSKATTQTSFEITNTDLSMSVTNPASTPAASLKATVHSLSSTQSDTSKEMPAESSSEPSKIACSLTGRISTALLSGAASPRRLGRRHPASPLTQSHYTDTGPTSRCSNSYC